ISPIQYGEVPSDLYQGHQNAVADHPLREGPAVPHRAGRGPVHPTPGDEEGGRVRPLPRGGTRAVPVGKPGPPGDAVRDHPGVAGAVSTGQLTTQAIATRSLDEVRPRLSS